MAVPWCRSCDVEWTKQCSGACVGHARRRTLDKVHLVGTLRGGKRAMAASDSAPQGAGRRSILDVCHMLQDAVCATADIEVPEAVLQYKFRKPVHEADYIDPEMVLGMVATETLEDMWKRIDQTIDGVVYVMKDRMEGPRIGEKDDMCMIHAMRRLCSMVHMGR